LKNFFSLDPLGFKSLIGLAFPKGQYKILTSPDAGIVGALRIFLAKATSSSRNTNNQIIKVIRFKKFLNLKSKTYICFYFSLING
jgi:hypothetical protein